MIKLVVLCDEANDYYVTDHEYAALEISYIAIDRRVQGNGIGTRVLARLISDAEKLSKILPIRFLVLDALDDKVQWYLDAGFTTYPKREDLRYADTVPMRIDWKYSYYFCAPFKLFHRIRYNYFSCVKVV